MNLAGRVARGQPGLLPIGALDLDMVAARTTRSAASGADKGDSSASTIAPCSTSTSQRAGHMKSRAWVTSTRLPSSRLFIARPNGHRQPRPVRRQAQQRIGHQGLT